MRQVPRRAPPRTRHGASVVSARGACGEQCAPSTRRRVMQALSSTPDGASLGKGDVVSRVRVGAFLKNGDCHQRSSNCVTCTDDTDCIVFGDGNVVGRNCIRSGDVHRVVSRGRRACSVCGYHDEDDACVASDAVCSRDTVGHVEFGDRRLLQTVMSGELTCVGAGETANCAVQSTAGCAVPVRGVA